MISMTMMAIMMIIIIITMMIMTSRELIMMTMGALRMITARAGSGWLFYLWLLAG